MARFRRISFSTSKPLVDLAMDTGDLYMTEKVPNQYWRKAKQIKLIVSQAFFLGKPMRDAAFFVVANHNHNESATKNHKHPIVGIKFTHAGSFLFMQMLFIHA